MVHTKRSIIVTPPAAPSAAVPLLRQQRLHHNNPSRRVPKLSLLMLPFLQTTILSRHGATVSAAFLRPPPVSSLRTTARAAAPMGFTTVVDTTGFGYKTGSYGLSQILPPPEHPVSRSIPRFERRVGRNLSSSRTTPVLRMSSADGDDEGTTDYGMPSAPSSSSPSSSWMKKNEEFRRYDTTAAPSSPAGDSSTEQSVSDYNREYEVSDRRREKQRRSRRKKSGVAHNDRVEATNRDNRNRKDETFRENFRGTRVFVQNLPDSANWQEVKDHFKIAGEVVFASVSIDTSTGLSKNCGVVQYETTDAARNAIRTMRDHPLAGNVLYVREDFQEREEPTSPSSSTPSPARGTTLRSGGTLASVWRCADESNAAHLPPTECAEIEALIQTRDRARRARNYDVSDELRDRLKADHRVHLDDRLKTWWYSLDGSSVPDSVSRTKGEGRWGPPAPWRMIPTTVENDACVSQDMVEGLLRQRDVARKEKDFRTADRLLEEAKYAPEGGDSQLTVLVNDEDRSWRIWTEEKPMGRMGGGGQDRGMSGEEKCVALVMKHEPEKVEEVKAMLKRFPGREYSILKRLKENYFN